MEITSSMDACSACSACKIICPVGAVREIENEKGFVYMEIDEELCIECGLCSKVCPLNMGLREKNLIGIYAFCYKSPKKRAESQSGGAFNAIAEAVISEGGVVYGVALDRLRPIYTRVESIDELSKLRGSKYVEAEPLNTFSTVVEDLKHRKVLFSGTPCHVAGLIELVGDDKNLITCDIICHGVPSRKPYYSYLEYLGSRRGEVLEFNFRDKNRGGYRNHVESFLIRDNVEISRDYTNLFYLNVALRNSCYSCRYARVDRGADLTLGDFWGIENSYSDKDDNLGHSVVFLRSDKAYKIFEKIKEVGLYWEIGLEDLNQPNLYNPTSKPTLTDRFWHDFKNRDFKYILRNYSDIRYALNIRREIIKELTQKGSLRNLKNIALAGSEIGEIRRIIAEAKESGIELIIDIYDELPDDKIEDIDVISFSKLSPIDLEKIDTIIVVDEVNMSDILVKLADFGIGMEYVKPLSFLISDEV